MVKNVVYYIAGPMTGSDDMGRARFAEAERKLKKFSGVVVLNPAMLPIGMPEQRYMPICLAMIEQSDVVMLLDGWESSFGARLEKQYAMSLGKFIMFEDVIRNIGDDDL